MKLKTSDLKNALEYAGVVVPDRPVQPILSCVRISGIGNTVAAIFASNADLFLAQSIDAEDAGGFDMAIPYKTLYELSGKFGDEIELTVDKKKNAVIIRNAEGRVTETTIKCLDPKDFPDAPSDTPETQVKMPNDLFAKSIERAALSAETKGARPVLNTVAFLFRENCMFVVSSDSYRSSVVRPLTATGVPDVCYLVPVETANKIKNLAKKQDGQVDLSFSDKKIIVRWEGIELFAPLYADLKFPDIFSVLPTEDKLDKSIVMGLDDLRRAVDIAEVFAQKSYHVVSFALTNNGNLHVSGESAELGDSDDTIPAETKGKFDPFRLDARYVMDGLKLMRGDKLAIRANGSSPILRLDAPGDDSFQYYIARMVDTAKPAPESAQ